MDWFTWLSKTGLEPALVYEYGLAFTRNELEEDDIAYLDHEFLLSMGFSIAKHRLEILKLARKHRVCRRYHLLPRILVSIRNSKRRVENYIRRWIGCQDDEDPSSALVLVRKDDCSSDGEPGNTLLKRKMKRKKKMASVAAAAGGGSAGNSGAGAVAGRLLLTDGRSTPVRESPVVCPTKKKNKKKYGVEEEYLSGGGVDEIRWDSLFQDLKPT
ncbi:hypothetical protein SAY86_028854 [Trapa natans]|uniref:SAM domain-containing protein n=1 Tax=Trapa natans TaxID=22666 RepID=A0AAN7LVL9_TRANT|nr:hypothetical protein SAY86_028854 [Trapa natans]